MRPDAALIDELVRRILQVSEPRRIILFGSAARGDFGPASDLDVLVVVSDDTERTSTAQRVRRQMLGFGLPTDVLVATESGLRRYGDNWSLVYYWALREGQEIYAA